MPAAIEHCGVQLRPASENLQGRKPRDWARERCGVRYGDLIGENDESDRLQHAPECCAAGMQVKNKRLAATNGECSGTI
jgi:hypothetical protein